LSGTDLPTTGNSRLMALSSKSSNATISSVVHFSVPATRTRILNTRRASASFTSCEFSMDASTSSSKFTIRNSTLDGLFIAYDALISLAMMTYAPEITPMENTPTAMDNTTNRVRSLLSHKSCKTLRHLGLIDLFQIKLFQQLTYFTCRIRLDRHILQAVAQVLSHTLGVDRRC